ncbi:MAG: serine protease [Gemmatimonadaceae bacterium]
MSIRKRAAATTNSGESPGSTPAEITLNRGNRLELYAAHRYIGSELEEKLKVRIPFDVYFQDPQVAANDPELAFNEDCFVPWEPNIADGPTSARFAVVDYDAHAETLTPPAQWDSKRDKFIATDCAVLDRHNTDTLQFHQVNVWALAQKALDFFENGVALGRRIPWGFDGNRLIVVPHAGPGENAYYDRESHSLQFYYFDRGTERIYTCLSSDIVNHEFGHAVLDGIRPYYNESVLVDTAAFHEFVGDLAAILLALRNNPFRHLLIEETKGDLRQESTLSRLAEQFGQHVKGQPYLRSARSQLKMKDVVGDQRHHHVSQVLTAAMFDIVIRLSKYYMAEREKSVRQAFAYTIQRMQSVAIQPLDLLPPVDVTFRDYALAVLRSDENASPMDPDNYRELMLDVFIERGILDKKDRDKQRERHHLYDRLDLDVFYDVATIASSRPDAYRFLDDNRRKLFIPPNADVVVTDLSTAQKLTGNRGRLPKQVLLQYIWREDIVLQGAQFGRYEGEMTNLLCGATLALNENGDVVAWARKPGFQLASDHEDAKAEQERGIARRTEFLDVLARRIRSGRIGNAIGSAKGLLARNTPPLTTKEVDGTVRFELTPHFGIHDDGEDAQGGRTWQISS